MKSVFVLAVVLAFVFPAQASQGRTKKGYVTYCGTLMLDCRSGYTASLWFSDSDHSINVDAEYCKTAASVQDQCMCMDGAPTETRSMFNGVVRTGVYYRQGSQLRACGEGSAAQRKVDADRSAIAQARAWCSGNSNVRPPKAEVLKGCNCFSGFFSCN